MVKGKYAWVVVLLVAFYAGWVAVSVFLTHATTFSWSIYDQKVSRMQSIAAVESVIVGGSNAVYSLSAEQLTELTGKPWFNAALTREGFTEENKVNYINDLAHSVDAEEITTVIVSSVRHFRRPGQDASYAHGIGFDGNKASPWWLPTKTFLSLVSEPPAQVFPTIVSDVGDLVHENVDLCKPRLRDHESEWATDREIDEFLQFWLPLVRSNFRNADIVITIPSRYMEEPANSAASDDYLERLQARVDSWIAVNPESANVQVTTILETNYDDPSIICTFGAHYNPAGRTLRTEALYNSMMEKGVLDGR